MQKRWQPRPMRRWGAARPRRGPATASGAERSPALCVNCGIFSFMGCAPSPSRSVYTGWPPSRPGPAGRGPRPAGTPPPAAAPPSGRGRRRLSSAVGGVHHPVPGRRSGAAGARAVAAVDAPHFIHSEADRLLLNKAFMLPALSTFPALPPGGQSAGLTRPGIACPCSDTWLL